MTFEEAAAIPTAAVLALHNLCDKRPIQPGQKVLINGAGGSVGTFAVQLAKYFGAEVTGVDSTKKLDMLRSIGADHVVDYTQEDFTKSGQRYDLIFDVVVHRSFFDYKRALSTKGICVFVGGSMTRVFLNMLLGPKKMSVVIWKPNIKDFVFLKELFEDGKVVPVIDRRYPLSEVAEALRYLKEGHAKGKVVITVEHSN
jgi:NADPH:quinone reductase-like Zn-dependent oxidoreductase